MKKLSLVFASLLVLVTLSASAKAQQPVYQDGTGLQRYTWRGVEHAYPGARVWKATEIPAGTTCDPVGELKGAEVENSTGNGTAITSVLTEKATIAIVNGHRLLCRCAQGYNEIFFPNQAAQPQSPGEPANSFEEEEVQQEQVNHHVTKQRQANKQVVYVYLPPAQTAAPVAKQSGGSTCGKIGWKCWLPVATGVGGYALGRRGGGSPRGGGNRIPPGVFTGPVTFP